MQNRKTRKKNECFWIRIMQCSQLFKTFNFSFYSSGVDPVYY